jgi:hypothetical protein
MSGARKFGDTVPILVLLGAVTLLAELALAIYQFDIFGRSRLRFDVVDRPSELALFGSTLVAAHALALFLSFRLLRWILRRRALPLFLLDFLFLFGTAFLIALVARTKIAAMLGANLSLRLARELGGGSLLDALAYVLNEALFAVWIALAAAVLYFGARILLRAILRSVDEPARALRWPWAAAAVAPLLLFAAADEGDVRLALDRFAAPWLAYAALDAATDVDRDGYGLFARHRDRQPFDPKRHPLALDVPDNGIDEDGLAGDYRHRADQSPAPAFGAERRHVVLIVLESARADALGKRWNGRPVTPALRALAARGAHSDDAYSHAGFTMPSLRTALTGRLDPVSPGRSLFQDFGQAGYRVGILSGQSEDYADIAAITRMRRNSDILVDAKALQDERIHNWMRDINLLVDGRVLLREFDRHFGTRAGWARPTFLYINLQTAHYPYDYPTTPRIFRAEPMTRDRIRFGNREAVRRAYWNSIAYADWLVGQVVARLDRLGVLDRGTLLVIGDHGEELFEHGYIGHGQRLNDLQTRIPFVISRRDVSIPHPVGLSDVRGVLLRAAGAELPPPPAGRPVLQYEMSVDRPSAIAMVEAGRRRTSLDLVEEEVSYEVAGALKLRGRYRDLPQRSFLKQKADALARLWAQERWIRHVDQGGAQAR